MAVEFAWFFFNFNVSKSQDFFKHFLYENKFFMLYNVPLFWLNWQFALGLWPLFLLIRLIMQ